MAVAEQLMKDDTEEVEREQKEFQALQVILYRDRNRNIEFHDNKNSLLRNPKIILLHW